MSTSLTVLLVDDDADILRLVKGVLESSGHRIICASDGADALLRIAEDCPDVVISDWDMPGLNGLELCRTLRGRNLPHYLYIILLTAKTDVADIALGFDAGADDYSFQALLAFRADFAISCGGPSHRDGTPAAGGVAARPAHGRAESSFLSTGPAG